MGEMDKELKSCVYCGIVYRQTVDECAVCSEDEWHYFDGEHRM